MRVVVGLSGGVDSTVAAFLLKKKGFDVVGLHLIIWSDETERTRGIAGELGIEFHVRDVRKQFRETIIDYFVESYRAGLTPNPCAFCNRDIKLRFMLEVADELGARFVATGHYLRVKDGVIYRGIDRAKDQSYFLALVPPHALRRLLTPLGELTKEKVTEIAKDIGVHARVSKESQDVCFLEGTNLVEFLRQHIGDLEGEIIGPDGKVLGMHKGTHYFTIGQRRKLGVSLGERVYITAIDPAKRQIHLGYTARFRFIKVVNLNWLKRQPDSFRAEVKIRQLHRSAPATVKIVGGTAIVEFDEPQWAPTPGQIAAFYIGDMLVGGGVIAEYSNSALS